MISSGVVSYEVNYDGAITNKTTSELQSNSNTTQ